MTPQQDRMQDALKRLRLVRVRELLASLLEDAARRQLSYADFLDELLAVELGSKEQKRLRMARLIAHFPFARTLDQFDFTFQPSIDPRVIKEVASGRFIPSGENVLLLGPPGVGKTHLAVALGHQAIEAGYSTLFVSAAGLVTQLEKAEHENRLDDELKRLCGPKLLIIDELGYLPLGRNGAHLIFQLVSRRYERGALIITSNKSVGQWGEVFGDAMLAAAILDRIMHHSLIVTI
jgi:DNA replication protein DnaC